MKIVLPSTYHGPRPIIDDADIVVVDPREAVPDEHLDAEVLVAWLQPEEVLADAASRMPRLRLVQGLAAGPDAVLAAGFGPQVALASGVGCHDVTVSQHALALTLALTRDLPLAEQRKRERRWDWRLGGTLKERADDGRVTSLDGARVTVWGFGSIASALAPLLAALGAHVTGVARAAGQRHGFPVLDDQGLDQQLAVTDVLIMILPATAETRRALDSRRLALLPRGALLVNVGRGSTVDEDALLESLRSGHLAGAALDVTAVEPLPETSPLWDEPSVIITPHTAGGRPLGADRLIADNVAALRAGQPLRNEMKR